jgi:hypothetical protein
MPLDIWNFIESTFSILLVIACIMQRSKLDIFSSCSTRLSKTSVKIGQFALYIQMMLGILTAVDGYYNSIDNKVHILLALFVLSSSLTKFSVYLNLFEKTVKMDTIG